MKFQGKVAVITGAGGAIGNAIAIAFASEGATVVAADFNAERAQLIAAKIQAQDGLALAFPVDVTDEGQVNHLVQQVIFQYARIDILVNNAGVHGRGTIETMSVQDWDRVININLKGVFLCSKAVIPLMKQNGGKIVNMTSIAGKTGGRAATGGANYAASKAGVIAFTKSLAKEMAPYGVNVNAVSPGLVKGGMALEFAQYHSDLLKEIPLGVQADPEDVADAVLFLTSDKSKHITGEILDVNGGWYMD
jgi:3-oxoacyl-[acyl-carrier protein] reductase